MELDSMHEHAFEPKGDYSYHRGLEHGVEQWRGGHNIRPHEHA